MQTVESHWKKKFSFPVEKFFVKKFFFPKNTYFMTDSSATSYIIIKYNRFLKNYVCRRQKVIDWYIFFFEGVCHYDVLVWNVCKIYFSILLYLMFSTSLWQTVESHWVTQFFFRHVFMWHSPRTCPIRLQLHS